MKPLNSHTTGCDPVSSNCVIWQGPDIPCIKLCKGDSISEVVFKLATELCEVLDQLDVSTYQLPSACFTNQSCNPNDFHDLIQLIIYKICCLESGGTDTESCNYASPTTGSGLREAATGGGCPDCTVDIARCFYYTNEFGDEITTMQLTDYTKAIGNKLCTIVNDILVLNEIVNNHEERITALENAPAPTLLLPTVTPTCVISPAIPQPMNVVLSTLEQQFCQLVSATGSPTTIYQAVTRQCLNLGNSPALGTGGGNMSGIPGWLITANTLASTINNMWLTICDLRSAVQNIQLNCCPSGCDGIAITLNAIANPTSMVVYINGTIPGGFQECDPTGNTFTISDSLGNSISVKINTLSYLNNPTGYTIDLSGTPINTAANLTITSDVCYVNGSTNTTCQFCLTYNVVNVSICPSITAIPDIIGTGVGVSYFPSVVPASYTVEIWDSGFTAVIATQTTAVAVSSAQLITFSGVLTPSTTYNVRLVINNGGKTTECGFAVFTTNPILCIAPNAVSASIALPIYCDTCGPAIDFIDNITVDGTYVDLSSPNLIEVSGGVISDFFQLQDSVVASASGSRQNFNTVVVNGKLFVGTNTGNIEVWENPTTGATQVAGSPFATGATSINDMCYDPATGLIFMTHNTGAQLGTFNPNTYTAVLNIVALGGSNCFIHNNPVSGEKYVYGNIASYPVKIYSAGATPTLVTTVTGGAVPFSFNMQPKYIEFNAVTGEAWVTCQDLAPTGLQDIVVIGAGPTYTPVSIPNTMAPYYPVTGSPLGNTKTLAYYPGDGSIGSDRMFACYRDSGTLATQVTELITTAPYTATVFSTDAGANSYSNILYSSVFNKLCVFLNSTFFVFDPTDSSLSFNTGLTVPNNAMWPYEDVTNELIFVNSTNAGPTDNLYWYGADPASVIPCTEGVVNMYLGNNGPYQFNTTLLSWDNMCTPSAVTVSGTTFQANATFTTNVLFGALLYSTDGGVTWNAMTDNSGNLYANPATWLAGRTYNVPAAFFTLKITFNTTNDCALESSQFSVV